MVDEARLRQKLRVEDLAQRMGFKQESSVSAYLRGRRTPKPATLVRYCQAVGLRAFLEIRGENETMVMVRLGDWGNANLLALMKISRPFGLRIALRIVQVP
jgi:transcriptional regulator with XRE-family HTH domain